MKEIGEKECKDTGIILATVLIIIGITQHASIYFKIATCILLVILVWPSIFKPFAFAWFALGSGLSKVSSTIVLCLVYVLLLLPVALLMKLLKRDELRLTEFKKGTHSVFRNRSHYYSKQDLVNPY